MKEADVAIIGGGIVGLATAYQLLQRHPEKQVVVLEKESSVGVHQTGHNSGVLHSGIYYKPGSLKAQNCRVGKRAMEAFCEAEGIPYDVCGKVIVAVDDSEVPRLERIFERGQANEVACEMIDRERLRELEPHAAGVQAIHVPESGIVNYRRVGERLAEIIQERGSEVWCDARVVGFQKDGNKVVLATKQGELSANYAVNCCGLQSDRMSKMTGHKSDAKILPFRGEFYELKPDSQHLCRNLIYPVPDPSFPFLGVHFTRMIDGGVECGPNAVLAFAREGYRKTDINIADFVETLTYSGFLRMAAKYWRVGAGEMWRSFSKAAFVKALQRLMPEIRSEHLIPARAGVRAQAISPAGDMVDDFVIQASDNVINVNNAPSPAATSSLNIGNIIVDKLDEQLS
ncbi:MAG: L-2-hydroxyglutarate oxidase [Planctomycetaceae bacterium]|nr:L-2-hydroxyglutarate oxidase [Planctomycetales bacterium]MCB9940837.1 L-2-hydroxyglutarate oxidase [Planctomycetaceae bacterium]